VSWMADDEEACDSHGVCSPRSESNAGVGTMDFLMSDCAENASSCCSAGPSSVVASALELSPSRWCLLQFRYLHPQPSVQKRRQMGFPPIFGRSTKPGFS